MPRRISCLTALLLGACTAETAELRVMLAVDAPRAAPEAAADLAKVPDHAAIARAFFFGQAEFYLAGARPDEDSKLADVMRAMGRDDLIERAEPAEAAYGCPRQWVEPLEMISRSARDHRIVIIETERQAAEQTAFAEEIIKRLAQDGFNTYADDGLTLDPGGAAHPEVLLVSEGMVTRDPAHGRLLREVKRHRMQLLDAGIWWTSAQDLATLSPAGLAERRQDALAQQVARRALAPDPATRVVFYTERSADSAASAALKDTVARITGENPLLIALTTGCDPADALPALLPQEGDGSIPQAEAELVFAIPQGAIKAGRQTAGRLAGEFVVEVPDTFLGGRAMVLVEARRSGDPDTAVPEDRLLLFPGDRLPLILAPGDYRIEAWTRSGPVGAPVALRVD